jgi:hypothetical protein
MLKDFYKYKELSEQKYNEIERLKAEYCCILTQCGEELRAISQVTNFDNLEDVYKEYSRHFEPKLSKVAQCKLEIEMAMFLGLDVPFEFESINHTYLDRYDIRFKLKNGNEYELRIPEFKKFWGRNFDTAYEYGLIDAETRDRKEKEFSYFESGGGLWLEYVEDQCRYIVDQMEGEGEWATELK